MPTLENHQIVGTDFQSAHGWHEEECPGARLKFTDGFRRAYHKIRHEPLLDASTFSGIRRLNSNRFPGAIFYSVKREEMGVLAVPHGSGEVKFF